MGKRLGARADDRPSFGFVLLVLGIVGGATLRLDSFRWGWFTDFEVLHLGGRLFGEGRFAAAYDPELFLTEAGTLADGASTAGRVALFISPPTFGWFMALLGSLSIDVAIVVWLVAGVSGLFAATWLLRLPWWTAPIVALTPAGLATLVLGQTGFLALFALAAIHRCVVGDRRVVAGLLVATLVVKPPLAVGIVLWWLADWRRWWPALIAAAGGSMAALGATVVWGGAAWPEFFRAIASRNELEHQIWYNQATLGELVKRLDLVEIDVTVVAVAGLAMGWWVLRFAVRRLEASVAEMSGLAILLTFIVSPHLLHYDMTIALVPIGAALQLGWQRGRVEMLAGSLVFVVAYAQMFDVLQRAALGAALATLPLSMLALVMLWIRWIGTPARASSEAAESPASVLVGS